MSRVVQTVIYMPYFVLTVVCCTLAQNLLSDKGAITTFLSWFGVPKQDLLAINGLSFWFINCFICIWQMAGYRSIYITTIASTNKDWYDAAAIDGEGHFRIMIQVMLPQAIGLFIVSGINTAIITWNAWFEVFMYVPNSPDIFPLQL